VFGLDPFALGINVEDGDPVERDQRRERDLFAVWARVTVWFA
jgi:hypothetical protein